MKLRQRFLSAWILAACFAWILAGCSGSAGQEAPAPFSALTWEASYEDLTRLEGEPLTTYDSVYGGTACTYAKEYKGQKGTLKYMFDDNNQLMCIAWAYETADPSQLDSVYTALHEEVVERYGESGYNPDNPTSYGDVWYLDSGHIILSAITTGNQCALQYAYLNPLASDPE
ncbi:MAG: hypothetical protein HFI41_04980 [Lachnospiraceae bacterium]|nr:hypothetical protein [Lachnospiraceae bacterium]